MLRVLVPIDGSRNSNFVVPHLIREFHKNRALKIHLLNVRPWFRTYVAQIRGGRDLKDLHREQGEKALLPARKALDGFGVPYLVHIEEGDKAEVIAATARRLCCDHIVMSTARRNSLTRMFRDSVTHQVIESTNVPVELIAGDAPSNVDRYGVPASIGAGLALAFLAAAD
ncbi:MAG: universal stress protein [Betaproteobacteria bacterium]|nr:universal stress protein [Betaproteobacteria bacterium]MBI2959326.1 universal stress protein [Betaproteobacteria bacterium]